MNSDIMKARLIAPGAEEEDSQPAPELNPQQKNHHSKHYSSGMVWEGNQYTHKEEKTHAVIVLHVGAAGNDTDKVVAVLEVARPATQLSNASVM